MVDVLPPKNFSHPGASLAAIVAGDSLFGGEGRLNEAGDEVRRYLPSHPFGDSLSHIL